MLLLPDRRDYYFVCISFFLQYIMYVYKMWLIARAVIGQFKFII